MSLIILLISCNSGNEKKITELFEEVNNNRINNKIAAIKACEEIISLDKKNNDAYRTLADLTFETGNFEKSLELNKKLIELNPKMYWYQAKVGLLLELFGRNMESQIYYLKARELLKQKEEYYWTKTDTLGMAAMFIEVGDSIRGRNLIDSVLERKNNHEFPEHLLRELQNHTHGKTLNLLKSAMESDYYSEFSENKKTESIIESTLENRD